MSETSAVRRQTETVYLYQGDDLVRIRKAEADYQEAVFNAGPKRLGDTPVKDAAEAYDALKKELQPNAIEVVVRALSNKTFRRMLADAPPRPDNAEDAEAKCNTLKMSELLLEHVSDHERTIIKPELGAKSSVVAWLDDLSNGDYSLVFSAAMKANNGGQPDPFVSLTSRLAAVSDETLQ